MQKYYAENITKTSDGSGSVYLAAEVDALRAALEGALRECYEKREGLAYESDLLQRVRKLISL